LFEQLKLLFDKGSMTVAEWQAYTGRDIPNGDPFYPVIKVENGMIILDREALIGIGSEAMYAWHREVLQAVIDKAQESKIGGES
jgi:hypothetical protein